MPGWMIGDLAFVAVCGGWVVVALITGKTLNLMNRHNMSGLGGLIVGRRELPVIYWVNMAIPTVPALLALVTLMGAF